MVKVTKGSKHYGDMYKEDKYSLLRIKKACKLALEYSRILTCHSVLDLGCYTMELRRHLPSKIKYTGIDMKEKHQDIINLDLNKDSLANVKGQFDLIFALEIIEHILYPNKLMRDCQELLKDEGVLTISLPNDNTIYHRIVMALGIGCDAQAFKPYKHVHFPTIKQQRAFISRYFNIVEEVSYISTDMHKSRGEWIGKIAKKIPDSFWQFLADKFPSLFARGTIFVCKKRV